jgi:hypothetical protein
MVACLGSVGVEASKASATAAILKSAYAGSYAHADAVRGSWLSTAAATGDPPVHRLAVDLPREIDQVLAESEIAPLEEGAEGAAAQQGARRRHSAFQFHYGLAKAFSRLGDARTLYQAPFVDWTLRRVVGLWPALSPATGRLVFVLDLSPEWELEGGWPELYRAVHGEDLPDLDDLLGAVVTHVNGHSPPPYFFSPAAS